MVKFARCPKIYVCHLLHRLVPQPIVSLLHKILNNITVKETMVPSVAIVIEVMVTLLILEVGVAAAVVDTEEIDMKEVAVVIDSVEVEIASEEVVVAIASEEVEVAAADLMIVQEDRMVTLAGGAVVAVVEVDMIIVMHRLEEEELEEEVADSRLVVEVPENALV